MNVFLFTSVPLNPPWDQGDKNLAYTLTQALPDISFNILTQRLKSAHDSPNLFSYPVYTSREPSFAQKAIIFSRWAISSKGWPGNHLTSAPDLYHLIYRPYPLSSWMLKRLPGFQKIPTIHTIPATAEIQHFTRNLFYADRLVVISRFGHRQLSDLGYRADLILPGIQPSIWKIDPDCANGYKARLGMAGRRVVLFPGHYGPGQGADTLVKALPDLVSRVPDSLVVFACRPRSNNDNQMEAKMIDAVKSKGLLNNVRFYRTIDNMKSLVFASDVVTLPIVSMSNKLDIPTTLLEFMASGKPVVISDVPPMNEIMTTESGASTEVGLQIRPGDALALSDALAELLLDPDYRRRLGENGVDLVYSCFLLSEMAEKYRQIYLEMTRASQRVPING